jgi:very-short-patch-repair endonuclease
VPHVKDASSEEISGTEVNRVVELVLEHARTRPQETLGVITMGITHARKVEAAIDRAVQEHPELGDFFDAKRHERFFVKNLERVQGDERDAIIVSIGYCKDASGTLPFRFGPLLLEGGERRLNVAITRARARMTVVSSFSHLDMDPGRTKARGVQLLRGFLEYASKGGTGLTRNEGTDVPLNDFEQDVCDALRAKGIEILPQWGASKYRIDLVAQHPQWPGQFVLAIECDGASYHSSAGARDRDRLRQQHLEALGWQFHRIWSTDWFLQRDQEIARVEDALRRAVAKADRQVTTPPAPQIPQASAPAAGAPQDPAITPVRPSIAGRSSIDEYSGAELDRLVRWIAGTTLKTDDEIVAQAVTELGFARRGRKIEAAIRRAIERVRRSAETRGQLPGTLWVS